jgi:hypothetical protein
VLDARGTYDLRDAFWAEPDIEDAAAWLQRLDADAGLRRRMGEAGRSHAQATLSAAPLLSALAANGIA